MDTIAAGSRLVLHLGVIVQPYRSASIRRRKRGKPSASVRATDTGQVAQWLEDKYGIMQTFFNVYGERIGDKLADGMGAHLESLLMGAPSYIDPFGGACSQIDIWFRHFIASKEVENVGIKGTPTKAAIMGVNHRLAHPYRKSNPRRPSFLDTGLYMGNFKSWMDSQSR